MLQRRSLSPAAAWTILSTLLATSVLWAVEVPDDSMTQTDKAFSDGNFKQAYESYRSWLLEKKIEPRAASHALNRAVQSLMRLNRVVEADALIEQAVARHPENWRLLDAAAQNYMSMQHFGHLIAGEFHRGHHRGGGNVVNSLARDRVRALQLRKSAIDLAIADNEHRWAGAALRRLANDLLYGRGYAEAWRLQIETDLEQLPDYEAGGEYLFWTRDQRGAPIDEAGNPIFYALPASWADATNDGERWRWALAEAAELNPGSRTALRLEYARFLQSQFGVQTIAGHLGRFAEPAADEAGEPGDDAADPKGGPRTSGIYALHTLGDGETIARLANGVRRFDLPDEFNPIRVYHELTENAGNRDGVQAFESLATIYENRRQYPRAAGMWRQLIARHGANGDRRRRLGQIVNNWGRFDATLTQPAGKGATIDYVFRNGKEVEFVAHQIRVETLLGDLKAYLKSNRGQLDWQKIQINDIGYRLVHENQAKYVGRSVANWKLSLEPRPDHFDRRVTITTPLQEGGAYLLTARMKGGNTSKIVVWLADLAIVKKPLEGAAWYYVADAVTGQPIEKANVEFFGYRQQRLEGRRRYVVRTRNFAEFTNTNGVVTLPAIGSKQDPHHDYNWLITATTKDRRLAFMGYTNVWHARYRDELPSSTKTYSITDRPVYRPGQKVHFKAWVRQTRYDLEDESRFAGQTFAVEIRNPKNERVHSVKLKADAYGGLDSEWLLPEDATLGVYRLRVGDRNVGTFRVEEYKKPEFEVVVDAPSEPVTLGDTMTAKIRANYYFGGPVTNAKVKYKVLRSEHHDTWYPRGEWDWLYGPGYGWFAGDYSWYRGWHRWGCGPPAPWWIWRQPTPPEVVAEAESRIGPDGALEIRIDTSFAKAIHGDSNHRYQITAEVTDQSRRTIVGSGQVLAAVRPFQVFAWVNRGFYRQGDTVRANFQARTLDGEPVAGKGELKLLSIRYENGEPVETPVATWTLETDQEGRASHPFKAAAAGQYRVSYRLTDAQGRVEEGAHLFTVRGDGFDGGDFQFSDLEIVPDRREYRPGEAVELQINCDRPGATVMLFARPSNGVYLKPETIRLPGKSTVVSLDVTARDMPNFFVEAVAVHAGRVHTVVREIYVPPERRVLNVEVVPSNREYLPGEQASVQLKVTDLEGLPVVGSTVAAIYDKSVEYISAGSNAADIKQFFWDWRRHHQSNQETNLARGSANMVPPGQTGMNNLGTFGGSVADMSRTAKMARSRRSSTAGLERAEAAPQAAMAPASDMAADEAEVTEGESDEPLAEATVRQEFADTALWIGALETNSDGLATLELDMPDNLTTWKIRVWGMDHGTRVGQGDAEVITRKNLIVRMQAPRFFVEKDEVVLSANVHNYLPDTKQVTVSLELDGVPLELLPAAEGGAPNPQRRVSIEAGGEARVDWRVAARLEGDATVRMIAQTDVESDAVQMQFPVLVHGMLKTESVAGVLRADTQQQAFTVVVPAERRPEETRLEVRYSPTLAGAMVDALPYLIEYPHGCTEQTLNRFLPAVITQRVLLDMGLDLDAIREKRTNLNAQEIGNPDERRQQWQRFKANPVFSQEELLKVVKSGVERLTDMQLSDGGWGWFSGYGEHSSPHTTAVVVHGLQVARQNDVALVPGMLDRGIAWLNTYRDKQLARLRNYGQDGKIIDKSQPAKPHADNLDALVHMVLVDAGQPNDAMRKFLYRDRLKLAVYSLATFGIALHVEGGHDEQLDMVLENIGQYVEQDDENQTAWLNLPGGMWWNWYGSEYEAHAYYVKLLAATGRDRNVASRMVKYLLNNRKHATYWNSTRDTALVIEAMAAYLRATDELKPDQVVEVWVDGARKKEVAINSSNLFSFDGTFVMEGETLAGGRHEVQIRRRGTGPVYFNAYLTNFTLEDDIKKAGLELKVERRLFKLVPEEKRLDVRGSRGQAVGQRVEKYRREPIVNLASVTSGELVEVELEVESKNDYEYILLEDPKAAGFEPVEVRSGYNGNELGAYVEFRDERVTLFVQRLARGRHSVSYRLRAEIPGEFTALPTRISAMYAPELKGNSDELKVEVE